MWCLAAVAAIAVAAVVVLVVRNRALGVKRGQLEGALTQLHGESEAEAHKLRAEVYKLRQEQDDVIREAERSAEDRTKAVLKGAARFLQSLAAEQTTVLDDIQRKYGGHSVLTDLLDVHHANAQMARKAQGIAVMCGAPIGRRPRPASVYDVVRSAQGQIRNFQRVEIMQHSGIALKAAAVAPVALTVAELLDNAASFSQQDAPIEVTFQRVQNSVCIVIDDAGVGMNDEDRQMASALLAGADMPRLSQLGNQPKFGFPVIGLLARQHGFNVDVTGVSRYGGVRAVVRLPEELWTMEETVPPAGHSDNFGEAPVSSIRPHADGVPRIGGRTAHGLPKRGARKAPIAGFGGGDTDNGGGEPQAPRRGLSGRGLGALQRGTMSGRDLSAPSPEGSEDV
ncbi:ATP-binding protein [Streptomyces sp. NPDC059477]|uniref:ATP-binding protein n=1 Tax=Streptomyces sp. NPDC059477 TaxID=3346847 RepID=UPI003675F9CE